MVLARYSNAVASVKGVEEADRILGEFVAGMSDITEDNLRLMGQNIVEAAKARTPIRTGRLLASNKVLKVTDKTLIVGNVAPYALYVHDGTSRMPARPFYMQPIAVAKEKFPALQVKDYKEFYRDLVAKHSRR